MRVIQSLWTLPPTYWLKRSAFLIQAYSICLARQFHPLHLACDRRGARIARFFGWEFDGIDTCLERFDTAGLERIWALGKIQTMLCQNEPAIHIDGDVLLSKPLPASFLAAPIVAQSQDFPAYYRSPLMRLARNIAGLPAHWTAYNTGIMGGADLGAVQAWCRSSMAAAKCFRTHDMKGKINGGMVSMIIEQVSISPFHPVVLFGDMAAPYRENKIGYRHYVTGRRTPAAIAVIEAEFALKFPDHHAHFVRQWSRLSDGQNALKSHKLLT